MKIAKKKVRMQTPLVNLIIDLERPLKKNGAYITVKCHNTPGDNDSGSYEINLPYYGGGTPEEWPVRKDKLFKTSDSQGISMAPQRYMIIERLLTSDAKATFSQAALVTGICTIDNFNKALLEMTKLAFPAYAVFKQKRLMCRYLIKTRIKKLRSFISSHQELNAYLAEFPPDTEGQACS